VSDWWLTTWAKTQSWVHTGSLWSVTYAFHYTCYQTGLLKQWHLWQFSRCQVWILAWRPSALSVCSKSVLEVVPVQQLHCALRENHVELVGNAIILHENAAVHLYTLYVLRHWGGGVHLLMTSVHASTLWFPNWSSHWVGNNLQTERVFLALVWCGMGLMTVVCATFAGQSGNRIAVGVRFSTPVLTGPGAHPASPYNGYWVTPVG
jgi:hypothetical protein